MTRVGLALTVVSDSLAPRQVEYLFRRLLDAQPNELPTIRDALLPYRRELNEGLWKVVEQPPKGQERQRLCAAFALAGYDAASKRWGPCSGQVVNDLAAVNPAFLGVWIDGFRPVRSSLLDALAAVFRDRKAERTAERTLATSILAEYVADRLDVLAALLMDSDERQFAVLFPKFQEYGSRGLPLLIAQLDRKEPPEANEDAKEQLGKRQANAAVALLRMGRTERVWPLLTLRPDPRVRSYFIHRLGSLGTDARMVLQRLENEPELSIRRALVLGLGEFGEDRLTPAERERVIPKLLRLYRDEPDPGLHAAVDWLLRRWQQLDKVQEINRQLAGRSDAAGGLVRGTPGDKTHWYVNGEGQTMVVIPGPVEFMMGSPSTEAGRIPPEPLHRMRIGRTFSIAAKPVTVEQFLRFRKTHTYERAYAPTGDCPIVDTTWYMAAEYCNWLSKQHGLPENEWCYRPNKDHQFGDGMSLAPDYLTRTGYRLPTEAELEYACRAGTTTSRYYGGSDELLGKYGWVLSNASNRSWPVGSLKPNDFGLFDVHGNVWQWCQERYQSNSLEEDREDRLLLVTTKENRVLRCGSFINHAVYARSACRNGIVPTFRFLSVGFRPARTLR